MDDPRIRWATTRDRVFRSRRFYAWAMVSNLVGRFAWAVTITPHGYGDSSIHSSYYAYMHTMIRYHI